MPDLRQELTPVKIREYFRLQKIANQKTLMAISNGIFPHLMSNPTICSDCGGTATCYDHRDYFQPLVVDPVCRPCNTRRGFAYGTIQKLKSKPYKKNSLNIAQQLVNDFEWSIADITKSLGCSYQSGHNWYAGKTQPYPPYRKLLQRLLELETRKEKE